MLVQASSKMTRHFLFFIYQSSIQSSWWRNVRSPHRLRTRLHQKMKRRALYRSSPSLLKSSFFCNQVFFGNVPSSSTSLLSSVGITTRITREVTAGADGNTRIPSISSPCLSQWHMQEQREGPEQELTPLLLDTTSVSASVWCGMQWSAAMIWARSRSSPDTLQSSCDLLQPGLLCLRSIFFNQSSFFGRHHDQGPNKNPNTNLETPSMCVIDHVVVISVAILSNSPKLPLGLLGTQREMKRKRTFMEFVGMEILATKLS